ncbi:MAG TPA: cyclic nucleotide-binding domain-containing protein [bacterium]|nr:cyclic nucleotide-binding domain-containing protein [bacterium]
MDMQHGAGQTGDLPWEGLLSQGQALTFRRGQTLIYKDHSPYGVFVILRGRVELTGGTEECEHEEIKRIPQGDVVGLHSVLNGTHSCCDVVAAEDCRTIFISKTLLLQYASAC